MWDGAQISHYIGIDVSSSGIREIRSAWESQRKNFTAEFFEADPCNVSISHNISVGISAVVFFCASL
ncbi:hypothetical protein SLA2020_215840 [Shorea laevis]